jgi:glutamine amidotransferase-like uncharacterized protein
MIQWQRSRFTVRSAVLLCLVSFFPLLSHRRSLGCTTAVISGRATADGRPILWKNRDTSNRHNEVAILSDGRYRVVAVINAGNRRSVWMGVNEAGLCIENSLSKDLRLSDETSGPGNGALIKRLLQQCATVDEVRRLLEETNESGRATDANFGVIDAHGGAALFEAGPKSYTMFDANDPQIAPHGYIVRTNFATTAQQLPPNPAPDQVGDVYSSKRYLQACLRLTTLADDGIDVREVLRNLTRDLSDLDGTPFPGSINAPGGVLPETIATSQTISRNTTVSAAVFHGVRPGEDPALTTMWTILGDPKFSIAVPCWAGLDDVADPLADEHGGEIGEVAITLRNWCVDRDGNTLRTKYLPGIWRDVWPVEDQIVAETYRQIERLREGSGQPRNLDAMHQSAAERAYRAVTRELEELRGAVCIPVGDGQQTAIARWRSADQTSANSARTNESPPKLNIAVYDDAGAGRSVNDLIAAIETIEGVLIERVTARQIREGELKRFDVVVHPGGSGGKQARQLGESGREAIRRFVRRGGGFIGVCAGAYLASSHYDWSLNLLDAKVFDTSHWARGTGTVCLQIAPAGRDLFGIDENTADIYYGQGPLLVPGNDPELPDYEVLAVYEGAIAKKGASAAAMPGTTAIARSTFGAGRVVCFSPHPEKTSGLEYFLQRAVVAVAPQVKPAATVETVTP